MKRRVIFSWLFLVLAIFVVGIFILADYIFASDNFPTHNGIVEDNLNWEYFNITTTTAQYLIFKFSSSTLISPEIDFSNCSSSKMIFYSRTYGGVVTSSTDDGVVTSSDIHIFSLFEDQESLIEVIHPESSTLKKSEIDFSQYCGQKIKIIFKSPNAVSSKGFGIDDVSFQVSYPIINQSPFSKIKIFKLGEETEEDTFFVDDEIFFDGSESEDEDGEIVEWWWDFMDNLPADWDLLVDSKINSSTTIQKFNSTGTKNILFWTVDDEGASSSPLAFSLNIIQATSTVTTTPTTTPPTTTPSIINVGDLIINELYPAPNTGEKEWIEILNTTNQSISLDGLFLLNLEGGKLVTTTLSGIIESDQYFILETFVGSLNNSGDTVILRDNDKIISETSYGNFSSKKGQAWARKSDGDYSDTLTPTPGLQNIITLKTTPSSGSNAQTTITKEIIPTSTIDTITTTTEKIKEQEEVKIFVKLQGKVIVNEIFPDPIGPDDEDEFIELKNISDQDIDLTGCYLTDDTKKKYVFKPENKEKNILKPGQLLIIKRFESKIALNNSGVESVNLFDPQNELIDSISYTAKKIEGKSYSRNENGEWLWSNSPTPGQENIFDSDQEKEELKKVVSAVKSAVAKASSASKKTAKNFGLVSVKDTKSLPDGSKLTVRGVVSVVPGVLGVQVFYIAGSGIQIYNYNKYFPELKIGDLVEVSGELVSSATGKRIKTSALTDIKVIENTDQPEAHKIEISQINNDFESWLIRISGRVLELKGRSIFLADNNKEMEVYVKTHIDLKSLGIKAGDLIQVDGILIKNQTSHRLLPRDEKDFLILEKKDEADGSGLVKGDFEKNDLKIDFGNDNYFWLSIVFLVIAGIAWFIKLKIKKEH